MSAADPLSLEAFCVLLQRSPDPATADEIRLFQVHLAETGVGICTRNNTMTGLRFLFRVTLRRHDLAAEILSSEEPQKVPMILHADETKRLLAMAGSLRDRLMLSLGYGAGLRSSQILRLKVIPRVDYESTSSAVTSLRLSMHLAPGRARTDRRSSWPGLTAMLRKHGAPKQARRERR